MLRIGVHAVPRRISSVVSGHSAFRTFFGKFSPEAKPETGLFGNELLREPAGFGELNRRVRASCDQLVRRIETGDATRSTVRLVDDLSNEICCAADLVECVRQMHCDSAIRETAEASAHDFCDLVETLNTRKTLYAKLRAAVESEKTRMDEVDRRTLELFLDDFEQSGVHLPDDQRKRFVQLSSDIFMASAKFQSICDRPAAVSVDEARQFGFQSQLLYSPLPMSSDARKRKFAHSIFLHHNPEQEANLQLLIAKRHELATLCGFPSYAHRAQFNTILGSYESAKEFLEGIIDNLRDSVNHEVDLLRDLQKRLGQGDSLGEWDVQYLLSEFKDQRIGSQYKRSLSDYLNVGSLMDSFESIVNRLYGIHFIYETPKRGEMWPSLVIKVRVEDRNSNTLGTVYLDIEHRDSKAIGDCHYTVRCSKEMSDGSWQSPVVVLSLSMSDANVKDWRKVNVRVSQAQNLFHEMGHAMHSMLGRTRYQHVAGTRCPQDMAEIPSNVMEYFFNDPRVLTASLKYQGTAVPLRDVSTMVRARSAFCGIDITQQAIYALFDLEAHGPRANQIVHGQVDSTRLLDDISKWALPGIERLPRSAFQHRFHHLVQYGARYYSYLVARSTASLIYGRLFASDPFSAASGAKWAEAQSHGGGVHPRSLLATLLGESPCPSSLIQAMRSEVDKSHCELQNS